MTTKKPLDDLEYAQLEQILVEAQDVEDELTEFEVTFLHSLIEQHEEFERDICLSDKQMEIVTQIASKL